jgi:hypothetical protein
MPKVSKTRRNSQNPEDQANRAVEGAAQEQTASGESTPGTSRSGKRLQELSPRTRLVSLVCGDILCFLIFVTLGSNSHGEGVNFLRSLWLSIPFLAAWFVVSPFTGAYRVDITYRPSKMLLRTLFSWVVTWPVAMAFRWFIVERLSPVSWQSFLSFSLVVLIVNLILLTIWRGPFAMSNSLRRRVAETVSIRQ